MSSISKIRSSQQDECTLWYLYSFVNIMYVLFIQVAGREWRRSRSSGARRGGRRASSRGRGPGRRGARAHARTARLAADRSPAPHHLGT